MTKPIRIQRKRTKGFWLQDESIKRNNLLCVYVGRPTKYGNKYKAGDIWREVGTDEPYTLTVSNVLGLYRVWLVAQIENEPDFLKDLRGRNLACFCREDQPCHADILLEFANK